ncbi:MAG: NAD-dependent epimerase/dehydratase family protein, partial [Terriglobales bacterium]
ITGGAGFIGSHLTDRLLGQGKHVTVLDNFNEFYDPLVKRENVQAHLGKSSFNLVQGDIRDPVQLKILFAENQFDVVVHLAAMAGVRPSLIDPAHYMDVNVLGTQRIFDAIEQSGQKPLFVFGSSSSVYGERTEEKFFESDRSDRPMSPYAASKIASEAVAFTAHHTRGLDVVSLRFFTVYGPRQRPDLAIHKFCDLMYRDQQIEIYGDGTSRRDYTYVDDIVDGVERVIALESPGYEVINLGRSQPVVLMDVIRSLEKHLGKPAKIVHKPMQMGDVPNTYAGIDRAAELLGYAPSRSLDYGIGEFVRWYLTSGSRKKEIASSVS